MDRRTYYGYGGRAPARGAYRGAKPSRVRTGRRAESGRKSYLRAASILLICTMLFFTGWGMTAGIMRLSYPRRYERIVKENCERFGVDESLVYAVIRTESGFDPEARSNVGALGLMQIMPDTFIWLQKKLPYGDGSRLDDSRLLDPEINIRYGVYFLSLLREEFGSDRLAAAAYHAGSGRVREWLRTGQLEEDCQCSDIPSGNTGHYVKKVESAREVYCRLYYRDSQGI